MTARSNADRAVAHLLRTILATIDHDLGLGQPYAQEAFLSQGASLLRAINLALGEVGPLQPGDLRLPVPEPPSVEDIDKLVDLHHEALGGDEGSARLTVAGAHIAVFPRYISGGPGYFGRVVMAVYDYPDSHELYIERDGRLERCGITEDAAANSFAEEACRQLVQAYRNGLVNSGSVDWEDVDRAHEKARQAMGLPPEDPLFMCCECEDEFPQFAMEKTEDGWLCQDCGGEPTNGAEEG